ncbi:MAG: hypothetical protein PHU85_20250 [Phycisphaerae bacterium]|nr:hypothetical protein [Phycisphaerae bacterium]
MRPTDVRPGIPGGPPMVGAVEVSACAGIMRHCPHLAIPAAAWADAIRAALERIDLAGRLGATTGGLVPAHQVFRVVVAGCPNACSRPQIADIGVIGHIVRRVDAEMCVDCKLCERACPDHCVHVTEAGPQFGDKCLNCRDCIAACPSAAITAERAVATLLAGGRLGRHPRLAETVAEGLSLDECIERIVAMAEEYATGRATGERFADWWGQRRA